MAKLLFVEDDLTPDLILELFDQYLSKKEREELESRRVKTPKSIKSLLDENPCIHVEYDFIEAINTIESHFEDFSFFVVDRNLYGSTQRENVKQPAYDLKEVKADVEQKCEGDYLFRLLYSKYSNPRLLLDNFFFLTAYPEDTLQFQEFLQEQLISFKPDHIIDKSIPETVADFVENKINKFEELVIKSEHREVFEIFSKGYLDANFENDLLSILKQLDSHDTSEIKKNVNLLREIFQETLRKIAEQEKIQKAMPKEFYQVGNPDIPKILTFLNGTTEKDYPWKPTTKEHFSYCSYLLSFFGFWKVCSEIAHGGKSGSKSFRYKPTRYTLPILVNTLLDFLIWFGDFMDKESK